MALSKKIIFILVLGIVFICGCSIKKDYYKKKFVALGTFVEITSPRDDVFDDINIILSSTEHLFNNYDLNSEVSRVNSFAGIKPVVVSPQMLDAIDLALVYYQLTDGIFDVCLGKPILLWKEFITKRNKKYIPEDSQLDIFKNLEVLSQLVIDREKSTLFIRNKDIQLDFGGMAKGYVVDLLAEKLIRKGLESFLINAGGDIYAYGLYKDKKWQVGIKNPANPGVSDIIEISDKAIATSGGYEQFFDLEGQRYSHIIDPRTLKPVINNVLSVTVISDSCLVSDIFATTFFIMGPDETQEFIKENNFDKLTVIFLVKGKETIEEIRIN